MGILGEKLDKRDVISLAAFLISVTAIVCYWSFCAGEAERTYHYLFDALYRFIFAPSAVISVSFFISSHYTKKLSVTAASLSIAKTVCLLLSVIYIVCFVVAVCFGGAMGYATRYVILTYLQVLRLPCMSFLVGLILGIRLNGR